MNVFNDAGFVLGAGLSGIAGAGGWRAVFAAPLVLTAVIIALAPGFDPAPVPVAGRAVQPQARE